MVIWKKCNVVLTNFIFSTILGPASLVRLDDLKSSFQNSLEGSNSVNPISSIFVPKPRKIQLKLTVNIHLYVNLSIDSCRLNEDWQLIQVAHGAK